MPNTHWLVILFLLSKLINSEQLACYASAITPFPSHPLSLSQSLPPPAPHHAHSLPALAPTPHPLHALLFPSLSSRCTLSSSPSLLMFWRWHTLQKPHDLWHCLVGQLLFPSLINFDVEPNEIRQLIKAAADSGLIYSCAWHTSKWQKLMRRSLYVSSGLREVWNCSSAVHQLPPEKASASTLRGTATLHVTAPRLTVEQEPPSFSLSPPLSSMSLLTAPFPFSRL